MTTRTVAIVGAESTGKSTLAEGLADHFGTCWVPEYLREFVEVQQRTPHEEDQYPIACEQVAREDAAAGHCTGWLFCDTTPMMTAIYSAHYFGRVDAPLAALAARRRYAFTVVTAPDGPWIADGLQRESAAVRQQIHQQVLDALAARQSAFVLVRGTLSERIDQVARALLAQASGVDQMPFK